MNKDWSKDTGLVFALVFMGLTLGTHNIQFLYVSTVLILVALLFPVVLVPLGWAWLKLSEFIHIIVSPVVFSLIFFLVVTPLGVLWRITKGHKQEEGGASVFTDRPHRFGREDILFPY